jgi:hypothetical protein
MTPGLWRRRPGIDRAFAEACAEIGIDQEAHPARWEKLDHPDSVIRYDGRDRPYNANAGPIHKVWPVATGTVRLMVERRKSQKRGCGKYSWRD